MELCRESAKEERARRTITPAMKRPPRVAGVQIENSRALGLAWTAAVSGCRLAPLLLELPEAHPPDPLVSLLTLPAPPIAPHLGGLFVFALSCERCCGVVVLHSVVWSCDGVIAILLPCKSLLTTPSVARPCAAARNLIVPYIDHSRRAIPPATSPPPPESRLAPDLTAVVRQPV